MSRTSTGAICTSVRNDRQTPKSRTLLSRLDLGWGASVFHDAGCAAFETVESVVDISIQSLRQPDPLYVVEDAKDGFALTRANEADPDRFNAFVRQILDAGSPDFVALPRPDGHTGYDGVFILPLTDPQD